MRAQIPQACIRIGCETDQEATGRGLARWGGGTAAPTTTVGRLAGRVAQQAPHARVFNDALSAHHFLQSLRLLIPLLPQTLAFSPSTTKDSQIKPPSPTHITKMNFPFPPGAFTGAITGACSAASEGLFRAAVHSKNAAAAAVAQVDPEAVANAAFAGARSAVKEGVAYAAKNPKNVAGGAVVGSGLLVAAVPAVVTAPALAAAGFGSLGPVAGWSPAPPESSPRVWMRLANAVITGTVAAGVQSWIGNVVGGSLFATFQSAAMGGSGAAAVAGAAQGAGATVVAIGGGVMAWLNRAKL